MDIEFHICPHTPADMPIIEDSRPNLAGAARDLKAWKKRIIQILKDSPSAERKFLRWKIWKKTSYHTWEDVEEGELDVKLDMPLSRPSIS